MCNGACMSITIKPNGETWTLHNWKINTDAVQDSVLSLPRSYGLYPGAITELSLSPGPRILRSYRVHGGARILVTARIQNKADFTQLNYLPRLLIPCPDSTKLNELWRAEEMALMILILNWSKAGPKYQFFFSDQQDPGFYAACMTYPRAVPEFRVSPGFWILCSLYDLPKGGARISMISRILDSTQPVWPTQGRCQNIGDLQDPAGFYAACMTYLRAVPEFR